LRFAVVEYSAFSISQDPPGAKMLYQLW